MQRVKAARIYNKNSFVYKIDSCHNFFKGILIPKYFIILVKSLKFKNLSCGFQEGFNTNKQNNNEIKQFLNSVIHQISTKINAKKERKKTLKILNLITNPCKQTKQKDIFLISFLKHKN